MTKPTHLRVTTYVEASSVKSIVGEVTNDTMQVFLFNVNRSFFLDKYTLARLIFGEPANGLASDNNS